MRAYSEIITESKTVGRTLEEGTAKIESEPQESWLPHSTVLYLPIVIYMYEDPIKSNDVLLMTSVTSEPVIGPKSKVDVGSYDRERENRIHNYHYYGLLSIPACFLTSSTDHAKY